MPEPEAHVSASSRDRILSAAKHLFALNGYDHTSTVAIARAAGTSESQLMKHFGSKQGLLAAIFERGWTGISERVRTVGANGSPAKRLMGVLEALALELAADAELKELMMLEARRVRKDNRDVLITPGFHRFAEVVDSILGEMRECGELHPDLNLDAARAALIGMTEGLLREQVVAKRSGLRADYNLEDIRKVWELLLPALAGTATYSH